MEKLPKTLLIVTIVIALHIIFIGWLLGGTKAEQEVKQQGRNAITAFPRKEGLRLQFPYKRIKPRETLGLGGGRIALHPCRKLTIGVRDTKNGLHEFVADVYFSRATRRGRRSVAESQSIPNILGVDFLKTSWFGFVYNTRKRIAMLVGE